VLKYSHIQSSGLAARGATTRCLYELDVRQSRRKQQRNDLLLLSGVVAFAAFAVAIAAAIVS
jgi:hypothetical protein